MIFFKEIEGMAKMFGSGAIVTWRKHQGKTHLNKKQTQHTCTSCVNMNTPVGFAGVGKAETPALEDSAVSDGRNCPKFGQR